MKILIRNLSRDVTQAELLALFEAHGRVQSCSLVMDAATGGSKGFGFVNMPVIYEAKAAVRALDGFACKGSKMRVKKAEPTSKDAPEEGAEAGEQAAQVAEVAQKAAAEAKAARVKKDGTRLGPKKARSFKKKPTK